MCRIVVLQLIEKVEVTFGPLAIDSGSVLLHTDGQLTGVRVEGIGVRSGSLVRGRRRYGGR